MCEWHTTDGSDTPSGHSSCVDGHGEIDIWSEVAKDIFGGVFIGE